MTTPARGLPHLGDLGDGDEGVGPVGVDPQVATRPLADGHQLAVVDARAVGEGHAHPVPLQLPQLATLTLGHPFLFRQRRKGDLMERSVWTMTPGPGDRKSTRLNSSHQIISYA